MDPKRSNDALNRLFTIVHRSLPMYLVETSAMSLAPNERAAQVLRHIAADQQDMARRIGTMILERGGVVDRGEFPMEFTDLNFLGFDYLLKRLVEDQIDAVRLIRQTLGDLESNLQAHELAEELLGQEEAHLEALEELVEQPA